MNALMSLDAAKSREAQVRRRASRAVAASPIELVRSAARRLASARGKDFRRELDALLLALVQPESREQLDSSVLLNAEPLVADFFARESSAVLAHEIVWDAGDQAFADWCILARTRWAEAALAFAKQELATFGAASPFAPRLVCLAMASLGDAIKWRAIAGRRARDLQLLHDAYRTAEAAGIARTSAHVVIDGELANATPESLYIRALLFDALCAGALSRQEMVIVDDWLLLWSAGFEVLAAAPGGNCPVTIGTNGAGGLEPCGRAAGPSTRFLGGLAGLRDRIGEVRARFHEGRLAAGSRFARALAVEHHVSALGRLEELLVHWANPAGGREKRSATADNTIVPLYVGLGEILGRGFGPVIDSTPASGAEAPAALASARSERADRNANYGMVLEPLGLQATVIDRSGRGIGIAVPRSENGVPSMGDLVGVREPGMLRVGRVVRQFADPASERIRVGIRIVIDDPERIVLVSTASGTPKALAEVAALFVPGADPDGQLDALLVSRATFQVSGPYEMTLGPTTYTIRLTRDQVSGRGWVAARFEILGSREA